MTPVQQRDLTAFAVLRVELGRWPTFREFAGSIGRQANSGDIKRKLVRFARLGLMRIGDKYTTKTTQLTHQGWRAAGVLKPAELDVVRVVKPIEPWLCKRCGALTFARHTPRTCHQLQTGQEP